VISRATVTEWNGRPGVGRQLPVVVAALMLVLYGCASSPPASTASAPAPPSTAPAPTSPNTDVALCAAAAKFQTARNELVGLNATAVGLDGVKTALQNLGAAASGLADAAQAALAPQVAELRQSISALGSTITGLKNQADLSAKFGAIATSVAVEQAAAPIMDNARTGCPGIPAASLPTGGVRAENPVIVSEQHLSGGRPRHHRPDESKHDRPMWPSDSPT
jgi:hypothetical protein